MAYLYFEYAIEKEPGKRPADGWTHIPDLINLGVDSNGRNCSFIFQIYEIETFNVLERMICEYNTSKKSGLLIWFSIKSYPVGFKTYFKGVPLPLLVERNDVNKGDGIKLFIKDVSELVDEV